MQTATQGSVLANRNFRLLFGGSTVSALGDQFTLVALPWLVLKLTGDPAALGLVLAAMALPRAIFMLIGGAVVDRMSPRRVLLGARGANALLVSLLAVLVWTGVINMPVVYAIALGIGLSTAFAYPASSSILPQLMEPTQLASANALVMGMRQMSVFVGPLLAACRGGPRSGGRAWPGPRFRHRRSQLCGFAGLVDVDPVAWRRSSPAGPGQRAGGGGRRRAWRVG
jgi:MFS family permease